MDYDDGGLAPSRSWIAIGLNQYNTAKAAALGKIVSQLDMAAQLARLRDFPDVARGGAKISKKEMIGIARFEQISGVLAMPATHAGHDFNAPGLWKSVSLKGPLLTPDGRRFPIQQKNIDDLFAAVRNPNTGADSIVIDLLGFSNDQASKFIADVQGLGLRQPVMFINP